MQSLWARLLAGEVAQPGSFSLRTIALVKEICKDDAALFTKLCESLWNITGKTMPLVYAGMYADVGLQFDHLLHLSSLGLIQFNGTSGYASTFQRMQGFGEASDRMKVPAICFGRLVLVGLHVGDDKIDIGQVLLTKTGTELAPVVGATPNESLRTKIIEKWRQIGYEVTEFPSA